MLDLHPDDIFWCTADPGWVTGTSYGIFAPLLYGVTNLVDEADFDADRWYHLLQDQKVTVWYTAPTAIRRLMRIPGEPRMQYDLSALDFLSFLSFLIALHEKLGIEIPEADYGKLTTLEEMVRYLVAKVDKI